MDSNTSAQLSSATAAIWARVRPSIVTGLSVQDRAIVAILSGNLDDETRAAALRAAHKLAGSLGTYGFKDGSEAARQLEQVWQSEARLKSSDAAGLAAVAVQLRLALPTDPLEDAAMSIQSRVPEAARGGGVLTVDDDETICLVVTGALAEHGYAATCVRDGRAAVDTIANPATRPQLVLLDIDMPGENGFRVLRRLRLAGVLVDTRVIMLTGRASSGEVHQAAALGAVDYVVKPLSIPLLIERVERAMALAPAA
ncbi:MAG: hypothetical protein NVSMB2_12990 [Chloroflexota bacterium]